MDKKGQAITQLQSLIAPLVGVGIVLVIGFLILAEAKVQIQGIDGVNSTGAQPGDDPNNLTSMAWNATGTIQASLATIPGWLPIIIITIIGAILLSLVSTFRRR